MTGRRSLPIVPSSPVARNSEALRIDRRSDPAQREAWTPFDASAEYTSESHARSASDTLFSFDDNSHKKSTLSRRLIPGLVDYRQIANSLQGKWARVYAAPFDVRLPKHGGDDDQIDTVIQPDVIIVSELRKLDDRGMRGAPEWVAEVLSPSTATYYQTTKLRVFVRAGVPEVWLIDQSDRTVTIYRIAAGQYEPPVVLELRGQTGITAVPGVSIDWDHVLAM